MPGTPYAGSDIRRFGASSGLMKDSVFRLDQLRRPVVLASLRETCAYRGWPLLAAHVHAVVASKAKPEQVMDDLKAYASHALVKAAMEASSRPKWARHGSTRWLWEEENVRAAIDYVVDGQGKDMDVFVPT